LETEVRVDNNIETDVQKYTKRSEVLSAVLQRATSSGTRQHVDY